MPNTENIGLTVTPRDTNVTFLDWRLGQDGPENSNMIKLDAAWGAMKNMVDGAVALAGGPNVASTVADMTDTEKVYVYLGSETGYTAGNWYYYDGSAWVSGGVYQAAAVQTDDTLTLEGVAADAKATGDAVGGIRSDVDTITDLMIEDANDENLWRNGAISRTGVTSNSETTIRTKEAVPNTVRKVVYADTGYKYLVFAYNSTTYDSGTCLGWWKPSASSFSKDNIPGSWLQADTDLDEVRAAAKQLSPSVDPVYIMLVVRSKIDNTNIGPSSCTALELVANNKFFDGTDTTLKVEGKAADAKATGDAAFGDVNTARLWTNGGISTNTGKSNDSTNTIRMNISQNVREIILKDPSYKYAVFAYTSNTRYAIQQEGVDADTYIGWWNPATGSFLKTSLVWTTSDIDLDEVREAAKEGNPSYFPVYFRVILRAVNNEDIGPSACSALKYVPYNPHNPITVAGIPVLALSGNTDGMSKDEEKTLDYSIFGHTGSCTVKWQGSSSINYPKKNYTIKLESDVTVSGNFGGLDMKALWKKYIKEARTIAGDPSITESSLPSWGNQTKFCAKANWIDPSHLRNIVNARLWGEIVASRGNRNGGTNEMTTALDSGDKRLTAPNYGAIDGFPIWIMINGENQGLYTLNIPKDKWAFDMSGGTYEYVIGGEANTNEYSRWKKKLMQIVTPEEEGDPDRVPINWDNVAPYDEANDGSYKVGDFTFHDDVLTICTAVATGTTKSVWESLFAAEVSPKLGSGTDDDKKLAGYRAAFEHFTELLNKANDSTTGAEGNWKTSAGIGDLIDVDSVFDYYIFNCCINGNDGFAKNTLFGSYGGTTEIIDDVEHFHSKWFVSAYDLDTTHGFQAYGSRVFSVSATGSGERSNFSQAKNFNGLAALAIGDPTFKARYWELRNGILSDDHIFEKFMEFGVYFSDNAYRLERNLWPQLPATSMHTLLQAAEFYKRHCAYLDKQVGPMENPVNPVIPDDTEDPTEDPEVSGD